MRAILGVKRQLECHFSEGGVNMTRTQPRRSHSSLCQLCPYRALQRITERQEFVQVKRYRILLQNSEKINWPRQNTSKYFFFYTSHSQKLPTHHAQHNRRISYHSYWVSTYYQPSKTPNDMARLLFPTCNRRVVVVVPSIDEQLRRRPGHLWTVFGTALLRWNVQGCCKLH